MTCQQGCRSRALTGSGRSRTPRHPAAEAGWSIAAKPWSSNDVEPNRRAWPPCRANRKLRRRFAELLDVAGRYAVIREHQARVFPAAWPTLRTCALSLGDALVADGRLSSAEQVFFLHRVGTPRSWCARRQSRTLEERSGSSSSGSRRRSRSVLRRSSSATLSVARWNEPEAAVPSHPTPSSASPRAPGSPPDPPASSPTHRNSRRFEPGDVLVAATTAPAWTPLFARAAAVVTDGGALAAHASIVAREYGIPAVVGTGDATRRIANGQLVTVNGTVGVVTLVEY